MPDRVGRLEMKKRAHRQGDGATCTKEGQDGPAIAGARDVFVNGRSATRLGDGGLYPLSCAHAGVPWRAIEGMEQVRVNGLELVATALWAGHPHSRGITVGGSADVFVGGPVVNLIERARTDGLAMIDNAVRSLERWNADDRRNFRRWYGDDSESARQEILRKLKATRSALETSEILFDADGAYAHVDETDSSKMWLEQKFWNAPRTGENSQGGVLIHEASHYDDSADTEDVLYGRTKCQLLAQWSPELAQANADNLEYFCETAPEVP